MDTQNSTSTSSPSKTIGKYCGKNFENFFTTYKYYGGYICSLMCVFGIIANIVNIVVLTRKHMITSINTLLTGLAVSDMLAMLVSLPYNIIHNIVVDHIPESDYYTKNRMLLLLGLDHIYILAHTTSIALTLTLAIWRYIAVNHPLRASHWCNKLRTRLVICICFLLPIIVNIPAYLCFSVRKKKGDENKFTIGLTDSARNNNMLLYRIVFSVFCVLNKLIPCTVLTVLSLLLARGLHNAGNVQKSLVHRLSSGRIDKQVFDKTTRMLLVVLVLFLLTEFPIGIIDLLTSILGEDFYYTCYFYLEEMTTLITLFNSAVNFIIYCTMSKRFRKTFVDILTLKLNYGDNKCQDGNTEMTRISEM